MKTSCVAATPIAPHGSRKIRARTAPAITYGFIKDHRPQYQAAPVSSEEEFRKWIQINAPPADLVWDRPQSPYGNGPSDRWFVF